MSDIIVETNLRDAVTVGILVILNLLSLTKFEAFQFHIPAHGGMLVPGQFHLAAGWDWKRDVCQMACSASVRWHVLLIS